MYLASALEKIHAYANRVPMHVNPAYTALMKTLRETEASRYTERDTPIFVGTALDRIAWVQVTLYAAGSGRRSMSATRRPSKANSRAAVQPPMLAPTTATSNAGMPEIRESFAP